MVSEDTLKKENTKNFYVDTSALMLNPLSIFQLASCPIPPELLANSKSRLSKIVEELSPEIPKGNPNNIYISPIVEWELNNIKDNDKKSGLSRQAARTALDVLATIRVYGAKKNEYMTRDGITLENGSVLKVLDYNEQDFKRDNIHLYEPNRDDRILYNYKTHIKVNHPKGIETDSIKQNFFGKIISKIKGLYKNHTERQYSNEIKKKTANKTFEIVTEDTNFNSKIIDTIGKERLNINCNFLVSERTQTPDASKKYTGVALSNVAVPLSEYKNIIQPKKVSYTLEEMTSLTRLDKQALSEILPNQFIQVVPDLEELSGIPENHYLRKVGNSFVNLHNYFKFVSDMENNASLISGKNAKIEDITDLTLSNSGIIYRLINDSNLEASDKKQLRKKLKRSLNQRALNDLLHRVKEHSNITSGELSEMLQEEKKKPEKETPLSRDQILYKPMHPFVLPAKEQRAYMELISDPEIGLVSFTAPQGAGKTLFALYQGLLEVKQGLRDKIVYMRPLTSTGEDIGFLPGDVGKKTAPAMQSCYDALSKIFMISEKRSFYDMYPNMKPEDSEKATNKIVSELQRNNILKTEIITFIQGQTISNAYFIIDEAQIFSRAQLKLLAGRAGEGTKLVIVGDFDQLTATNSDVLRKYAITVENSGLSHLIEAMMKRKNNYFEEHKINRDLYGHVSINYPFTRRSAVSELAQHF